MKGTETFPVLQALFQKNISGPLPKSAKIALQSSQSSNSSAASDSGLPITGGILKDGRYSWLSRGSKLIIILTKSRTIVSIYDFNQLYRELRFVVTACCVCENILIVGLKGLDGGGCIAAYNPLISNVLKAIDIPYPVSSLGMVSCQGGATSSTRCLCKSLRWMFGIVAVGTEEGHVYLVDLRFDSSQHLESMPSPIQVVSPSLRNIPKTRENSAAENAHLAFELQASCHEEGVFHYALPDDEILESFYPSDATVTTLLYEPRVASLFVGFSFGQFQIFSLQDSLNLVYSSDLEGICVSVLKFAFQEPENDPRKFCYLWVARGNEKPSSSSTRSSGPLTLSMFQLGYSKKEVVKKVDQDFKQKGKDFTARVLYKKFEVCNLRFEHSLGPGFITNISDCYSSNLLMCSSIEKFSSEVVVTDSPVEETDFSLSPSTSFCVFGWISSNGGRDKNRNKLGAIVFDINRWYMAQMPRSFHGDEEDFLFAGFWSFDNERQILSDDDEILGMHVPSDKIRHFVSGMRPLPERFFLPSACSFSLHFLTNRSLNHYSLFGYQQQVLNSASELKSMCLVNPERIHEDILASELYLGHIRNQAFTPDMMRENILTTALEHGQVSFLLSVVQELATGHLAACGCTLRFVMDWAWKSVANVKNAVDELCVPIFDCTSPILDALTQGRLQFNSAQIHHLCIIFQKLMEYTVDASDKSKEQLKTKLNVVALISQYLKVVQWFIGHGLLPEQLDNVEDNDEIMTPSGILIYKYTRLRQVFDQRRSELKRMEAPDLLLIDGWIEEIGQPLTSRWLKEEGGKATYPPPSFMTLLDMYYLDCVDVITKHCLVMYMLYDVLAMFSTLDGEDRNPNADLHETQRERLNNIATFMRSFAVPVGIIKLTQGFWMLDHKNFQDALNVLLDPDASRPTSVWQERRILRAFLYQGHPAMALKFLSVRHPKVESLDDAKMHITIYVKTRESLKAWNLVQMSMGQHDNKELFTHLFTICQKHSQLDQLLKLPFSKTEEERVIDYLKNSDSLEATQILILFYLQQSRYVDAIKLHSQTKHIRLMRDQSEESRRRNAKLDHIVQSYSNLLPKIEREFIYGNRLMKQRPVTKRELYKPSSLTAVMHPSEKVQASSHVGLIMSLMEKMEQKKRAAQETVVTPLRRRRFGAAVDSSIPERSALVFPTVDSSKRRNSFEPQGIFGNRSSFGSPARPSLTQDSHLSVAKSTSLKAVSGVKERRLSSLSVASMLLQTPPITKKRRPSIGRHEAMQSIQTPQSILKVKRLDLRSKGRNASLSDISQTSSRMKVELEKGPNDTIESSVFTEASGDIKHDIPTISTPSAKLFNQTVLGRFKLETAEDGEERKPSILNTPKILRFAGIDSSADDSGLSHALSSPVEQVEGLPNLTPVRVQAEDCKIDDEMEVDVTGDEIEVCAEDQEQNFQDEVPVADSQDTEFQVTSTKASESIIPGNDDQIAKKVELSDVAEEGEQKEEESETDEPSVLLQEAQEVEEKYQETEIEEPTAALQFLEPPTVEENPSEGSEEVICLDSSSDDDEENPLEESVDELLEDEPQGKEELVLENAPVEEPGNENLRLILTSSDESFEGDDNRELQEEDGYGTEEFSVEQEENQDDVIHTEQNLTLSLSAQEKPLELENTKQEESTLIEAIKEEDSDRTVTKDVLLSQTSCTDLQRVDDEIGQEFPADAAAGDERHEPEDENLSPELIVPHLNIDQQENVDIEISEDEKDVWHGSGDGPFSKKDEDQPEEAIRVHLSTSQQELSCETERREADSSTENASVDKDEHEAFNLGEVTSDYQSMSATKMEGVPTSPDQEEDLSSRTMTAKKSAGHSHNMESTSSVEKVKEHGTATTTSETSEMVEVKKDKTLEKTSKPYENLPKIEVTANPSTPVLERIQTEPNFVLSPPTTRRSKRTRVSKGTQYTPKPTSTAQHEEKKEATRSTSKQTQDTKDPTFFFSPPQTRKRPSKKKGQTVVGVQELTASLTLPVSASKRTRSGDKSPSKDSDHSSSTSPVRRSSRNLRSNDDSLPDSKVALTSLSRETEQSPLRKASRSHTESDEDSSQECKPAHTTPSRKTRQSPARTISQSHTESLEKSSPERKPAHTTPSRKTRQSPARTTRSRAESKEESLPEQKPAHTTPSRRTRRSPARTISQSHTEAMEESSPEREPAHATPSRKTRQSSARKTTLSRTELNEKFSPERVSAQVTTSKRSTQSPAGKTSLSHTESKEQSSPERKPAPATPTRKTRQSPARKAPATPTRSSRRLKSQTKLNVTSDPELHFEPEPNPDLEEEPPVPKRTRGRKTSGSSDVASSGAESETPPTTPSLRSTRRSTAKLKSSPKEALKFPVLTPVVEEDEEAIFSNKKRKKEESVSRSARVTRSTASYPTRMRRKAKVFKLEE